MLTEIKISTNIYDLQKEIQQLQSELDDLGDPAVRIPELIENSNLIRLNEYLIKSDQKKTNLISIYEQYSKSMGVLLSSVFEIQAQLKEILHEQSSLIESKTKLIVAMGVLNSCVILLIKSFLISASSFCFFIIFNK